MIIEETTTYAYKLKYIENLDFDRIRAFAQSFVNELPQKLVDDIFYQLNHGLDLLQNEPQMLVYLHSYGKMHEAKLRYAFDQLPDAFREQSKVNIIDYGCGQAFGIMCYADFLRENGIKQNVGTITLIEPSEICLKRAALHSQAFFPNTEIRTICKFFDDLDATDLNCDVSTPTLHIFSNVLDILDFDLGRLASLISSQIKCYHQFVCVGPYFHNIHKDQRINDFSKFINGNITFSKFFEKGELNPEKTWTAQITNFSVGNYVKIHSKEHAINNSEKIIARGTVNASSLGNYRCSNSDGRHILFAEIHGTQVEIESNDILPERIKSIDLVVVTGECDGQAYSKLRVLNVEEDLSTIVTEDDLCGGLDDDYCLYSPDGKRMILYGNIHGNEYEIKPSTIVICDECFFDVYNEIEDNILSILHIPKSVKYIGENPFCRSIDNIICDSPHFIVENGFLLTKDKDKIVFYFGKEKCISIPKGITCIGSGSFCSLYFSSIVIPSSVNKIEDNPFVDAFKIENYELFPYEIISESTRFSFFNSLLIDNIEKRIIAYCGKDTELVIPNGIKIIGKNAFFKAVFEKVVLPNSVEYIDETAFYCCFNLNVVSIPVGNYNKLFPKYLQDKLYLSTKVTDEDIKDGIKDEFNCVYSKDGNYLLKHNLSSGDTYTIKNGTKVICDDAFNLEELDEFSDLQQIIIPDSVLSIGDFSFYRCGQLQNITIPKSVTYIGKNPFMCCTGISIKSDSELFIVKNEMLIDNKTNRLIAYCGHNSHVLIPNLVTSIGDAAFLGYNKIQQITIPESVTSIGSEAFAYCNSLRIITIPNSVTSIEKDAFDNCESLRQIIISECFTQKIKKMLDEVLWDKIRISAKATKEDFENGIEDIFGVVYSNDGELLLKCNCQTIKSYKIREGTKVICNEAFGWCESLRTIVIPDSATIIGDLAFGGCKSLKKIVIPNSVTEIGNSVFLDCKSLRQITISSSVKSIGDSAFEDCKMLQQIVIPNSVTEIGNNAFWNCKSLNNVSFDSETFIGEDAFFGCSALQQISIPYGCVEQFKIMLPQELWDKVVLIGFEPPDLSFLL